MNSISRSNNHIIPPLIPYTNLPKRICSPLLDALYNFNPANEQYHTHNLANVAKLLKRLGEDGLIEEYTSNLINKIAWAFNLDEIEFQEQCKLHIPIGPKKITSKIDAVVSSLGTKFPLSYTAGTPFALEVCFSFVLFGSKKVQIYEYDKRPKVHDVSTTPQVLLIFYQWPYRFTEAVHTAQILSQWKL